MDTSKRRGAGVRMVARVAAAIGIAVALSGCVVVPANGYYHPYRHYYYYPY